jgi:hypothetical protein
MPYGKCIILYEKNREEGIEIEKLSKGSKIKIFQYCENCKQTFLRNYQYKDNLHRCRPLIDGMKKCCICKNKKEACEFPKNRASFDGYGKICKECFSQMPSVRKGYAKRNESIKNNIKKYFIHKAYRLKGSVRTKIKNLYCDVDGEFLYDLYNQQEGKCYYSGIDIVHNKDNLSFDSISVDRKDPDIGYMKDNIVLCAFGINSLKGSLKEDEFKQYLQKIIPGLLNFIGTK